MADIGDAKQLCRENWEAAIIQSNRGLSHAQYMATNPKSKKNPAAVALGRLGGLKGGVARAKMLTPAERKESARKAALARWANKRRPTRIAAQSASDS